MRRPPNIVFIVIDSLRLDRLGVHGYDPALTPNLDRLARRGLLCVNHFSVGCPTAIAFPGIVTSSLPFDHGGYNDGIHHRPRTFVESLRDAGYHTVGITTSHGTSSFFGYDRGFDEFVDLVDIHLWFRAANITILGERVARWQAGELADGSIVELLEREYGGVLAHGLDYLGQQERHGVSRRRVDRTWWRRAIAAERRILDVDPLAIARKLAVLGNDHALALGSPSVDPKVLERVEQKRRRDAVLNRKFILSASRQVYDASAINRVLGRLLAERSSRPFFAFVHYLDLHEAKLLLANLEVSRLATLAGDLARALRNRFVRDRRIDLFYDSMLPHVDRHVGDLVRRVRVASGNRETVFVLTGDHGMETGHPARGVGSDLSRFFFDDFLHVPLILHGPGIAPARIEALMSHLDVGPTILDLAGASPPSCFRGRSVFERVQEPAPYLLFENAGKGRCDLDRKALYFGIRSDRLKLVYEAEERTPRLRELYDLDADPDELSNLAGGGAFGGEREIFERVVRARLDEVRPAGAASARP